MFSDPEHNLSQLSIDPGSKVADLGCGTGQYAIPAAKMAGKNGHVYAIDVQQELLAKLKTEALEAGVSNISVIWGDVDEPNGSTLHDGSVDRCIVANVLFQVDDDDQVAVEAYRVLRPGGLLLVVDWTDSFGGLGPQPSHIITADQAQALFEKTGFTLVRPVQAGDHHYGLVFKK